MINALACPRCSVVLKPQRLDSKTAWHCPSCAGLAINLAALRADVEQNVVGALWQLARGGAASALACPSCRRGLSLIHYADDHATLEADLCTSCQMIWLDYGELDAIRRRYTPSPQRPVIPRASQPSLSEIKTTDDLSTIGTAADLVDFVLRVIWSTFH
jgi:Zn-finger nucleic acid-binding protein